MLLIVWKQKHQSEHGTCDKKIWPLPPYKYVPFLMSYKKGIFFTPLPPVWTNVFFSAIFFFGRHP